MRSERGPYLSVEDYLASELTAEVKHEYADGRAFAMTGTSKDHNLITLNLAAAMRTPARADGCQVYVADLKVRIDKVFYYPDVIVECGDAPGESHVVHSPCLVVEVLSHSTEAIDRGEKFLNYRKLPSLLGYLLVSQTRRQVELFRRVGTSEIWQLETFIESGSVGLPCPNYSLSLDEIYAEVGLENAV